MRGYMFMTNFGVRAAVTAALVAAVPAVAAGDDAISDGVIKIGVLNDMSGIYADMAGRGSVIAAEMAAEEFGGAIRGRPIVIVSGDHQNKPDVGVTLVNRWIDEEQVDVIADIPTSSVLLAVQEIGRQKNRLVLASTPGIS